MLRAEPLSTRLPTPIRSQRRPRRRPSGAFRPPRTERSRLALVGVCASLLASLTRPTAAQDCPVSNCGNDSENQSVQELTASGPRVVFHYSLCDPADDIQVDDPSDPADCWKYGGNGLIAADPPFLLQSAVEALNVFAGRQFAPPLTTDSDSSGNPLLELYAFDHDKPGSTYAECMALSASAFRNAQALEISRLKNRSVLAHELFHKVQQGHIAAMPFSTALLANGYCLFNATNPNFFGQWVGEAQATLMAERWSDELDAYDGTDYYAFMTPYLTGHPGLPLTDQPLTEVSYSASLFWSWCGEQMGSVQTPPVRGSDFVRTFWETAAAANEEDPQLNWQAATDSMGLLDAVIAGKGRGSVAEAFHDFAIACYTHELERSSIIAAFPQGSRHFFAEAEQYAAQPGLVDYPLGFPRVQRRCYCLQSAGCTNEVEVQAGEFLDGVLNIHIEIQNEACPTITFPVVLEPAPEACSDYDAALAAYNPEDPSSQFPSLDLYEACERQRVRPLTADYHQIDVTSVMQDPCGAIDIRARACAEVGWALVGVGPELGVSPPRREALFLRKGRGTTFSETVVPRPGLERLALIVVGLEEEALYEVHIDRTAPRLVVLQPTAADPAFAGLPALPDRFLIRARLEGVAEGIPAMEACPLEAAILRRPASIDPEDVQVEILLNGELVGEAEVLSVDRVEDEYWIQVFPPLAREAGAHDLRVRVGRGCAATEEVTADSVLYGPEVLNHVVVIDRSASMTAPDGNTKLDAAKLAAKLYVSAAGTNDRVGIVTFSGGGSKVECISDATVIRSLALASDSQRSAANTAIDAVAASGTTSIGDGIWLAQDALEAFAGTNDHHTMLILSDGLENEERRLFAVTPCGGAQVEDPAFPRLDESAIVTNTIAFGPETNQEVLQLLAEQTGGIYRYIPVEEGAGDGAVAGGGAGIPVAQGLGMTNGLALAFMDSLARARELERIAVATASLDGRQTTITLEVDEGERSLSGGLFFFHWDVERAVGAIELRDPSGSPIDAGRAQIFGTDHHRVLHLRDAKVAPGRWEARLTLNGPTRLVAGLLARDRVGLQINLRASQPRPFVLRDEAPESWLIQGIPVTIRCALADARGPVRGAEIEVTVERPDGSTTVGAGCEVLRLRDDGAQDDGAPNDGLYGLVYTRTQLGSTGGTDSDGRRRGDPIGGTRGSYIVRGTARGKTNAGESFERPVELHFQVFDGVKDRDGDGLPTGWEIWYGTDPDDPTDRLRDPDGDQLNNLGELANGTDPRNPDTDGSGELDGTELRGGRCPTQPGDDALPAPRDVEVVTDVGDMPAVELPSNGVLLRFPWNDAYLEMKVQRASSHEGPFAEVADLVRSVHPEPFWVDEAAPPGVPHYYRVQAVAAGNALSRPSPVVLGRSLGDPDPPTGGIVLHHGWALSDRLEVRVDVVGAPTAAYYRASHRPLRGDEPVERLVRGGFSYTFPAFKAYPAAGVLWVQLLNADGVGSRELTAAITIDLTGDADGDRIPNSRDDDDDGDGLDDDAELDRTGTDPFDPDTDHDGVGDLEDPAPLDPSVPTPTGPSFRRGDANADGLANISDAVRILDFLFLGGVDVSCRDAADTDDTGTLNITDPVLLLSFLFLGGPAPVEPFAACGRDRTADRLECKEFRPCR